MLTDRRTHELIATSIVSNMCAHTNTRKLSARKERGKNEKTTATATKNHRKSRSKRNERTKQNSRRTRLASTHTHTHTHNRNETNGVYVRNGEEKNKKNYRCTPAVLEFRHMKL